MCIHYDICSADVPVDAAVLHVVVDVDELRGGGGLAPGLAELLAGTAGQEWKEGQEGENKTQKGTRCAKTGDMGYVGDWVDGADGGIRVSFM